MSRDSVSTGAVPCSTARSVTAGRSAIARWPCSGTARWRRGRRRCFGVAARQAALLRGWTSDVTVVDPGEVVALRAENGTVRALVRRDGSEVACEGVLVHAPLRRRGSLSERLGLELTENGLVAIDALARTSVAGVYAAGDVAVAPQQVAIALGSGHLAGVSAARELLLGRADAG